jgi:hypothetical protein
MLFSGLGQMVDPTHRLVGPVGGQVGGMNTGGAGIGLFTDHHPFGQFLLIPVSGRGRVDAEDQTLDPGPQLTGRLHRCSFQRGITDFSGQFLGKMDGLIGEDPRPSIVDHPLRQGFPHIGESDTEGVGQSGLDF